MKRLLAILIASLLALSLIPAYVSAAEESFEVAISDDYNYAFDYDDETIDQNGKLSIYPNDSDEDLYLGSEVYNFRYIWLIVCDEKGNITEIGNNLLSDAQDAANAYAPHGITIPANGFAIAFFYNDSHPANSKVMGLYNEMLALFTPTGAAIYNTMAELDDCTYSAEYSDVAVTFYRYQKNGPSEKDPEDESEEEESSEPVAPPTLEKGDFTAEITEFDAVGNDNDFSQIVVYKAESEDRVVTSDEFNLRYSFILICDAEGKIVEAGNNIVKESADAEGKFAQHEITIPAGGYAVTFKYNDTNNQQLNPWSFYKEVLAMGTDGADLYNATVEIEGCDYTITLEDNTINFNRTTAGGDESSEAETSDAESEAVSEDESAATSEDASADTSAEASTATSEGNTATSEGDTATSEEGSSAWIWILVAVVAVVAVVVVVIIKKKK